MNVFKLNRLVTLSIKNSIQSATEVSQRNYVGVKRINLSSSFCACHEPIYIQRSLAICAISRRAITSSSHRRLIDERTEAAKNQSKLKLMLHKSIQARFQNNSKSCFCGICKKFFYYDCKCLFSVALNFLAHVQCQKQVEIDFASLRIDSLGDKWNLSRGF